MHVFIVYLTKEHQYCRHGVKLYPINQSINQSINQIKSYETQSLIKYIIYRETISRQYKFSFCLCFGEYRNIIHPFRRSFQHMYFIFYGMVYNL